MAKKKIGSVTACVILTAALVMSGCSTSGSASSGGNALAFSDTTVTGTVQSVDGEVVTLTLGGGGMGGQMPGSDGQAPGGDGQAPEKPDGDGQSSDGTDTKDSDASTDQSTTDDSSASTDQSTTDDSSASDDQSTTDDSSASTDQSTTEGTDGSSDQSSDGQPPEQPDGEQGGSSSTTIQLTINDTSVLQSEDGTEKSMDDISEGSTLQITINADGEIEKIVISEGAGTSSDASASADIDYTALKEITSDTELEGESLTSEGTDENTILVSNGAAATLTDVTAKRDSDDSTGGDNSSFYGVGADLLVTEGTAYVSGGTYTTDAQGGAGLFAYGEGTVYASDSVIQTKQDTSGGIHAAGGGTFYGWDLDVETEGESSAAIRSDRGGGTMVVDGGSYVSNGVGSPAVYCTADIAVNDATLTANGSEGVCIEGLNTLRLYDCDLTGNMSDDEQNDCTWNVILYQSMSGDSEVGNSTFQMTGGSLTAENGGMFYTTNTESTFYLSDVDLTYADENDFFLRCTGNSNQRGWGQSGENGADCTFTADAQEMEGDVVYDSISNLDFHMTNGSTLTGAVTDDESCAGDGGDGACNLYISADSTWIVTGDSTLTALNCEGTITDESGKSVSIVGTDGTGYVTGDSAYTVTVGSYSETADMSEAASADSFSDHAAEKPEQL